MTALLNALARCRSGATAVEYGLFAGLIAVGLIPVFTHMGETLKWEVLHELVSRALGR